MKLPKIDRDDLICALNDHSGLSEYYLDLETGHIICDFGDDFAELGIEEEDLESNRFVYINPIPSWEAYNVMVHFIETVQDTDLKRRLSIAIDGRGAFRMFKATLADYPEEEKRWFEFREKKMEEYADEWLTNLTYALKENET